MSETNKIYSFMEKKGKIGIPLVNDLFFHLLMQECRPALVGIVSGVLKIDKENISEITVLNPIKVGEKFDAKMMILDVLVTINNTKFVNIEMQVINKHDWVERTLNYIYRMDDDLKTGEVYTDMKEVYQIGIMDYTLFEDYPEFCSTYKIMNINENHNIYTDKLQINVIDLTHIELATDEDKESELDKWAKFFKTKDWEELQMLAQENEAIKEASEIVADFVESDHIKKYIEQRARKDELSRIAYEKKMAEENKKYKEEIKEMKKELKELAKQKEGLAKQVKEIEKKNEAIAKKDEELAKYKKLLKEAGIEIK